MGKNRKKNGRDYAWGQKPMGGTEKLKTERIPKGSSWGKKGSLGLSTGFDEMYCGKRARGVRVAMDLSLQLEGA